VYMEGMVVELDNEVWLLLTEHLLTPPHSLRVGALVSENEFTVCLTQNLFLHIQYVLS